MPYIKGDNPIDVEGDNHIEGGVPSNVDIPQKKIKPSTVPKLGKMGQKQIWDRMTG